MLQTEPIRVVANKLAEAVAVLTSEGWASSRPYTFQKEGVEIVFDTSDYVELYRQKKRLGEARITSAAEMRQFLRDNEI